jgi:hypothetical protein
MRIVGFSFMINRNGPIFCTRDWIQGLLFIYVFPPLRLSLMLAKWFLRAVSSPILAALSLNRDVRFPTFANRKNTVLHTAANMVQLFVHWIQESTRKSQNRWWLRKSQQSATDERPQHLKKSTVYHKSSHYDQLIYSIARFIPIPLMVNNRSWSDSTYFLQVNREDPELILFQKNLISCISYRVAYKYQFHHQNIQKSQLRGRRRGSHTGDLIV